MNNLFKSFALLFLGSILSTQIQSQNISINLAGAAGHSSAILDLSDVSNAHLGFLMPNVSLASSTDATTINPPVNGMIVWNTNASMPFGVGYYYWSAGQWNFLVNSATSGLVTANNGLNVNTGNNVQLGGTLAQNTSIALATYSLTLDNGTFNVNSSTGGNTNIGTGGTGTITIGNSGSVAQNTYIYSGTSGVVDISAGPNTGTPHTPLAVDINWGGTGATYINCGGNTGTVNIASTSSAGAAILIGTGTGGSSSQAVTIGANQGASALTLYSGTSGIAASSTATTGTGMSMAANSLTSGTGLSVTSTSTAGIASGTSTLFGVSGSGANANTAHTSIGENITVTNTNATSGTNIAGQFSASGATTANHALNVTAGDIALNGSAGTSGQVLSSAGANTLPTWSPVTNTAWGITGNSNIVDGTNFLGTTNTVPINFKINGTTAGRIDYNGGNGNTFLGYAAGAASPTGVQTNTEYNVAVGDYALNALSTGTRNIAIGSHALYVANSASYNTAIGREALYTNSTGSYNIGIGPNSLVNNTTGSDNTVTGTGSNTGAAADNNTTGWSNAVYGYAALQANTGGSGNVAIGDSSLNSATGSFNTALGFQAGVSVGALVNTTSIGNGASATASNMMAFGNGSIATVLFNGTATTQFEFNGAFMPYYSSGYNAGTTGQVLTSKGAGAAPQWTTISSGGLTGANGGLSTSGSNAILGGALGTPSTLTQNSEIGTNGKTLTFSVASPNSNTPSIGIDLATNTAPAQALEIGGTANTIRIDGLQSGNNFYTAPGSNSAYMLYSNSNGDIYSIPAGTSGYILTQTATGPQWQANGSSLSGTAGGVFYGTGTGYGVSAAGSAGNVLMSNGTGAPTWGTPSTSVISANNGLSMSGSNVQLGGNPLIGNTSLALATYSLTIDGGPIVLSPSSSSTTAIGGGGVTSQSLTINGGNTGNTQLAAGTISGTPSAGVDINWGTNSATYINGGSTGGVVNIAATGGATGPVTIGNNTGFTGINQATPKSTLDVNGSFATALVTTATSYTLDPTSNTCIATAGTYTITLPSVTSVTGRQYNIVYNGAANLSNIITVQGNGTDAIVTNGASSNTFSLTGGSVTLQSNGTNWYVVHLQESTYSNTVYPITTNTYAYASGDFTTSSASLVAVTGSALTLPPGTYQITACADGSNNSTSYYQQLALVNTTSTLYYGDQEIYYHASPDYLPWSVTITVTLSASTTYKIETASSSTSGTAYVRNARINAIRVQ